MYNYVEKEGKTYDDAVEKALEEMQIDREEADIEVLDEGGKGLLGLIAPKCVRVRVRIRDNRCQEAENFISEVLYRIGAKASIDIKEDEEAIKVDINGRDSGVIIGKRGETLDAIQYLTSLVVNRGEDEYKRVIIDVEKYRERRKNTLVSLARRMAEKVEKRRKNITLEPMNPYERRIIHSTLQAYSGVRTYSIGEEPNRKVVISVRR